MNKVQSLQINAFLNLLEAVNTIPGVKIDLHADVDRQRDALAFVIDQIYRQFKDSNWQLLVEKTISNVHDWNTPPNAAKATTEILKFVRHLYEAKIIQILNKPQLSEGRKKRIEAIFQLYMSAVEANLKHAQQSEAVNFAGIPENLLPKWYKVKKYLTTSISRPQ